MASLKLVRLTNRKLLKITGPDCYPYLQGLICNDLRYLYEPERIPPRKYATNSSNVMSTFMLNAQGKAICDMLIYRTPLTRNECHFTPPGHATEPDELLIECDAKLASGLANTLFGYRVRRKIALSLEDKLSVWCLFIGHDLRNIDATSIQAVQNELVDPSLCSSSEVLSDNLTVVSDPRLASMGLRIITDTNEPKALIRSLQSILNNDVSEAPMTEYILHRFILGIGEGVKDHPESNCFPLECNADLLGSVSFTKGCYLGQELTSRIHHTGVVRKRLMPLLLDLESSSKDCLLPLIPGSDIIDGVTEKKVGTLRHVVKNRALALLRHEISIKSQQLIHAGSKTKLFTYAPFWWDHSKIQ